ncbi:MAG: NUDIX hydrolase [Planctomycetes bacterium]|nr:NUDIX hydrolase [Planctomycetota bacterium]
MHRDLVRRMLAAHRERWPEDGATADRIGHLVESRADCLERACEPGHVTASAWIVSADLERCLLTHHRKLGRWLQLGGHADGEPDPRRVALTEAREESGMDDFELRDCGDGVLTLDIDVHAIPARRGEPEHEHHDFRFLFVACAGQRLEISDESLELRWFAWDELPDGDESVGRMAERARRLLLG